MRYARHARQVLDSLDAVGLRGDGRILQLNSYENRVFQVFLEDGRAVVAKFYRPGRWSDAQIVEEHAFALELAAAEVPVVPPLVLHAVAAAPGLVLHGDPPTLACHSVDGAMHRFAVAERCAGRAPELEDPATLAQHRPLHRPPARGGPAAAVRAPAPPRRRAPTASARMTLLLHGDFVPPTELPAWQRRLRARAGRAWPPPSTRRSRWPRCACTATATAATCCGATTGPHVVDLDDACRARRCRTCGCCCRATPRRWRSSSTPLLRATSSSRDFDDRELALIEPLRTLRMIRHSAWLAERWGDPTFPVAFPCFGTRGLLGAADDAAARADRGDGRLTRAAPDRRPLRPPAAG